MSVRAPVVPRLSGRALPALGLVWALAGSAAEPIQTGPTSIAATGPLQLTVDMQLESDGLRATARWLFKPQSPTTPTLQRSPRP
jgi:hypothetical protein